MTSPGSDIIERLEKATGPDRILDGLIYRLVQNVPEWKRGPIVSGHVEGPNGHPVSPPAYTASIDAAMTIFADDPTRDLKMQRDQEFGRGWHVSYRHMHFGHAPTLPIAACISALRARAAQDSTS